MKKIFTGFVLFAVFTTTLCLCAGCTGAIPAKPCDATLEFWIAENVSSVDFTDYINRQGVFGACEYFGRGYSPVTENGEYILPQYYVIYTVGGYPDTSDSRNYVTRIQITDPAVRIYGITCGASLDEFDKAMAAYGYKIAKETDTAHIAKSGKVTIRFVSYNGEGKLTISVKVTNKKGVVY